jgi:hypothetical protein
VVRINLAAQGNATLGTGVKDVLQKFLVDSVPVTSNTPLAFNRADVSYEALLYEVHDRPAGPASAVSPNWFGVALPTPRESFDLTGDVFVILYFHPTPGQAGYNDDDYFAKSGASGTDWKRLYAYVDRLGAQMAGANLRGAPTNRLVVVPILRSPPYTLPTSEWFNVIHDILQDINKDVLPGVCTRPKKLIVATISNGSVYLNKFLADTVADPVNNAKLIEAWDFDSEISRPQVLVKPLGKRLRAYWQNPPGAEPNSTYIQVPQPPSWNNYPAAPPVEIPPLPDNSDGQKIHHCIRDTLFLDAVINIEADNP